MGFEWVMGIFALLGNIVSNMFTKENNEHAAQLNYKYGELSAENAQKRQIETYQKLYSLPAQMDQIEQAGLSPGLIYSGTGGASGSTPAAPQGAGAGGQQGKMFDIMANMDVSRMQSEIALNEAQARKLNAEAEVTENTGESLANATITELLSKAGLQDAQKIGEDIHNTILSYDKQIKEATYEDSIKLMHQATIELDKKIAILDEEWKQNIIKTDNAQQLAKATIDKIQAEKEWLIQQVLESKANIKINQEQLKIAWQNAVTNAYQVGVNKYTATKQAIYWDNQAKLALKQLGITKEMKGWELGVDALKGLMMSGAFAYSKFAGGEAGKAANAGFKTRQVISEGLEKNLYRGNASFTFLPNY